MVNNGDVQVTVVKAKYGNDIRKTQLRHDKDLSYDDLILMTQRLFDIPHNANILLKYRDDDDDFVTLANDNDLLLALNSDQQHQVQQLYVEVYTGGDDIRSHLSKLDELFSNLKSSVDHVKQALNGHALQSLVSGAPAKGEAKVSSRPTTPGTRSSEFVATIHPSVHEQVDNGHISHISANQPPKSNDTSAEVDFKSYENNLASGQLENIPIDQLSTQGEHDTSAHEQEDDLQQYHQQQQKQQQAAYDAYQQQQQQQAATQQQQYAPPPTSHHQPAQPQYTPVSQAPSHGIAPPPTQFGGPGGMPPPTSAPGAPPHQQFYSQAPGMTIQSQPSYGAPHQQYQQQPQQGYQPLPPTSQGTFTPPIGRPPSHGIAPPPTQFGAPGGMPPPTSASGAPPHQQFYSQAPGMTTQSQPISAPPQQPGAPPTGFAAPFGGPGGIPPPPVSSFGAPGAPGQNPFARGPASQASYARPNFTG